MRRHVYSVRHIVVPINSSLLTALFSSVRTTLVYNDTKMSVPFMAFLIKASTVPVILMMMLVFFLDL